MLNSSSKTDHHGQQGALSALLEVAQDPGMQEKYSTAIESMDSEDYEQLISLAWRYQFDEDRSKFKRELREMQVHVSAKILARLEIDQ